jgi:hypothetical protein
MKSLAFIGNGEPPAVLFNMWRKQTPGRSGVWGQLRGVDNYKEADIFAVIDKLPGGCDVDPSRCVFLGAHPPGAASYADMRNQPCLAKADCRETVGFLEWWIDHDYDFLQALEPPAKPKPLVCIISGNKTNNSHQSRLSWLNRFTSRSEELPLDLYGRIKPVTARMQRYFRGELGNWDGSRGGGHMAGKEHAYLEHKYAIEFDVLGEHYFSERVLDSMLLWSMPIYWGCPRLEQYLPVGSFRRLDIDGNGNDVLEILASDHYEQNIGELREARRVLLDELQLWPRVHKLVFGQSA